MKWMTRSRVHMVRLACPRPIIRFIDSGTKSLFVPKSTVLEIA